MCLIQTNIVGLNKWNWGDINREINMWLLLNGPFIPPQNSSFVVVSGEEACWHPGGSGTTPYYLKSTDNGITWGIKDLPHGYTFSYVKFFDIKNGAILSQDKFIETNDGGNTWVEKSFPNTNINNFKPHDFFMANGGIYLFLNYIPDTSIAWTYGPYEILKTTDDGLTWVRNKCPLTLESSFDFIDENEGWFGGFIRQADPTKFADIIYHTTDAGKNWELQLDTVNDKQYKGLYYYKLKFYNKLNGISIAYNNDVYLTSDGGKHWIEQVKGPHDSIETYLAQFNEMCFVNKDLIFAINRNEIIFRYDRNIETGVEDNPALNNIDQNLIYPNPVSDYLYLKSITAEAFDKIQIFSTLGIKAFESNYKTKIDVSKLAPGLYILKIGNAINKFIKL